MKALSITRPWPALILRHGKDVENRTWNTSYRGPILLHAAQSWSKDAMLLAQWIELRHDVTFPDLSWRPADHPTGIVGIAELIDVCSANVTADQVLPCPCGPWAMPGQHHWRLTKPRPLPEPVPCRGSLSLWNPPAHVAAAVAAQIEEENH